MSTFKVSLTKQFFGWSHCCGSEDTIHSSQLSQAHCFWSVTIPRPTVLPAIGLMSTRTMFIFDCLFHSLKIMWCSVTCVSPFGSEHFHDACLLPKNLSINGVRAIMCCTWTSASQSARQTWFTQCERSSPAGYESALLLWVVSLISFKLVSFFHLSIDLWLEKSIVAHQRWLAESHQKGDYEIQSDGKLLSGFVRSGIAVWGSNLKLPSSLVRPTAHRVVNRVFKKGFMNWSDLSQFSII